MTARRVRWEVTPVPRSLFWSVTRNGVERFRRLFKFRAVEGVRACCRFELREHGTHAELMVRDRRGRYTAEGSTYGDDPREISG